MARVIFHVDLDAFYVSAERRENPDLVGKPVLVGSDPKGGKGRGVVMAASYEARKLGIRSGLPISLAYRQAPDAVYLPPNFSLYGTLSDRVMLILRRHADLFEQVSIDEAFLDVTQRVGGDYARAREHAAAIKADVRDQERLTCSVGVAPNKSTAKIASDMSKPDGLLVVEPDKVKEFLFPLPVSKISGVGRKTEEELKKLGIETVGQLAAYPPKELQKHFGKGAIWLWGIATGEEQLPVEERTEPKSLSAEHTFERDTEDWETIRKALEELVDDVHWRTSEGGYLFRTVGIKIRFRGFETHTRERTLATLTADKGIFEETAWDLLQEFRAVGKPIRLIGARVSHLSPARAKQGTLQDFGGQE